METNGLAQKNFFDCRGQSGGQVPAISVTESLKLFFYKLRKMLHK